MKSIDPIYGCYLVLWVDTGLDYPHVVPEGFTLGYELLAFQAIAI